MQRGINVAAVKCGVQKSCGFYGPEQFSGQEKRLPKNDVVENNLDQIRPAFIATKYEFTKDK